MTRELPQRLLAMLGLLLFSPFLLVARANADVATIARSCNGCTTLEQMTSEAWNSSGPYIPNHQPALFFIVSDAAPLSAEFKLRYEWEYEEYYGWFQVPVMDTLTIDYASAIALDNMFFARAAKVTPIAIPASVSASVTQPEPPELLIQIVQQNLVPQGLPHFGLWHWITGAPTATYWEVRDTRTGETHEIYVGDTITLVFSDGSSVQVKFLGAEMGSIRWEIVQGSQRGSDGKPLAPPTALVPSSPVAPGAAVGALGGSVVTTITPIQWCATVIGPQCGTSIEWPNTIVAMCTRERVMFLPC